MTVEIRLPTLLFAALLLPLCGIAHADEQDDRIAALFDKPVLKQTMPAKAGNEEVRCTSFSELTIRETGTDSPAPGPAAIVPGGGAQHLCRADHVPGEIALRTANFSFIGRKSGFLLFGATDPNGAEPFVVLDVATGKALYADSMVGNSLKTVVIEAGDLNLRFTRGVNASCSLMKDARGCWAKLAADGAIPRVIAQAAPPSCSAAYTRDKAPPEDPSIVVYEVDMIVSATGKPEVRSRGAVGCLPMP